MLQIGFFAFKKCILCIWIRRKKYYSLAFLFSKPSSQLGYTIFQVVQKCLLSI